MFALEAKLTGLIIHHLLGINNSIKEEHTRVHTTYPRFKIALQSLHNIRFKTKCLLPFIQWNLS